MDSELEARTSTEVLAAFGSRSTLQRRRVRRGRPRISIPIPHLGRASTMIRYPVSGTVATHVCDTLRRAVHEPHPHVAVRRVVPQDVRLRCRRCSRRCRRSGSRCQAPSPPTSPPRATRRSSSRSTLRPALRGATAGPLSRRPCGPPPPRSGSPCPAPSPPSAATAGSRRSSATPTPRPASVMPDDVRFAVRVQIRPRPSPRSEVHRSMYIWLSGVAPSISQIQTSPLVRCRHSMSDLPSPLKSPVPTMSYAGSTVAT